MKFPVSAVSALMASLVLFTIDSASAQGNFTAEQDDNSTVQFTAEQLEFYDKVKTGECKKIGSMLCMLVDQVDFGSTGEFEFVPEDLLEVADDKVVVDLVFTDSDTALSKADRIEGFEKTACYKHICSGYAHIAALTSIAQNEAVVLINPAISFTNAGSVTSEGDRAQQSDVVRNSLGLTGAGITVGVMSDSYNCLGGADADIATGDLPAHADITVLLDQCIKFSDEGRAMMQIIRDVAPDASQAFHTAFGGAAVFAQGIRALAAAGCDVIVDDIFNSGEPHFQDGIVAQAANEVAALGIPYFSSAGNYARNAWIDDTGFRDSGITGPGGGTLHDFNPDLATVDVAFGFLSPGPGIPIILLWDEPFASAGGAGCASDLDFHLQCVNGPSLSDPTNNVDGDAIAFVETTSAGRCQLLIEHKAGPLPQYLKIFFFVKGSTLKNTEYDLGAATSFGHPNAANVAGVGAAPFFRTPAFGTSPAVQEDFSSAGGTPIFFDTAGKRLAVREIRKQPRFVGPDQGSNTFFGESIVGVFRFFGTSASAPHVAGIAALMLESDNALTPAEIYDALERTAEDMDDTFTGLDFDSGFDFGTGYGFVNADKALALLAPPTTAPPPPTTAPPPPTTAPPPPTTAPPPPTTAPPPTTVVPIPSDSVICFSGENTVEVQGKGMISIDSLKIGDWVRVRGDNKYAQVYSLSHWNKDQEADFFQITAKSTTAEMTVEATADHLLYALNGSTLKTVPASDIKVGDLLVNANGTPAHVVRIGTVKRSGIFAPFTTTGDIVVSGLVASNYATIYDEKKVGFPISFHWMAHYYKGIHRMACSVNFDWCNNESYTAEGISEWNPQWLIQSYAWFGQQGTGVQTVMLSLMLPMLFMVSILEKIFESAVFWGILLGGFAFAYVKQARKAWKVKSA